MGKKKQVHVFWLLAALMALQGIAWPAMAQQAGTGTGHPYVKWVSQFPEHKFVVKKDNAARRIYNFLVQKDKENTISRPVAITMTGAPGYWILDQGAESVLQVARKKVETPRSVKKKDHFFTSLVGICSLPDGDILFTDSRLNKVYLVSSDGRKLQELNDTLPYQQPTGIAYNSTTNEIWVVETAAHRVRVLDRQGKLLKTFGSRGTAEGEFNFPTSIWIDKNGDAYIVDAMNFRVQIFSSKCAFITAFGEAGDGGGAFARPKGIAVDTHGNIYVADALFHAVQIFDRAGNFLYSFGKQGREEAEFWMPSGLFIDTENRIYVADSYNSRVQVFQLVNGS